MGGRTSAESRNAWRARNIESVRAHDRVRGSRTTVHHKRRQRAAAKGLTIRAYAQRNCPLVHWAQRDTTFLIRVIPRKKSPAQRFRDRYRHDMEFRLYQIVRSQVRKAIRPGVKGSRRTLSFLGYTAKQLREHIEQRFTVGMDWDSVRAGRVHIDHIVPRCMFDHLDAEQVRACWALGNLRPLWAEENLRKGAKIDGGSGSSVGLSLPRLPRVAVPEAILGS